VFWVSCFLIQQRYPHNPGHIFAVEDQQARLELGQVEVSQIPLLQLLLLLPVAEGYVSFG
jgi:hypothetical protein